MRALFGLVFRGGAGYGAALEPSASGAGLGRCSNRIPLDRDLSDGQQQLLGERGSRGARGEGERFDSLACSLIGFKLIFVHVVDSHVTLHSQKSLARGRKPGTYT